MPHYVGLDASKHTTSICVMDEGGEIVREGTVSTEPSTIVDFLQARDGPYARIGFEAVSCANWLYEPLARAGLPVICIDPWAAHQVLKARRRNKTDKNDARGIAEVMRSGLYRAVHLKSAASHDARRLLSVRRCLVSKRRDLENLVRETMFELGLKLRSGAPVSFERRAHEQLPAGSPAGTVINGLLKVRAAIVTEIDTLEKTIEGLAQTDPVCQRLLTAPGVGPLTALSFRAAIDVPQRFARSRDVGVHLGLTPPTRQSGRTERRGRISGCGDRSARAALWLAALVIMRDTAKPIRLKRWGLQIKASRGAGKAIVAVARRLAVILHRMWLNGTDFREEFGME